MKQRCSNPNNPRYSHYGGRGIGYCPSWESFDNFFSDMGEVPEGLTLERKDNELGYSKDNCVWATVAHQNANKRPFSKTSEKHISLRENNPSPYRLCMDIDRTFKTLEEAVSARDYILSLGDRNLPETGEPHIYRRRKGYRVCKKGIIDRTFKTLEEALEVRNKILGN
jgi:hypothetical protein